MVPEFRFLVLLTGFRDSDWHKAFLMTDAQLKSTNHNMNLSDSTCSQSLFLDFPSLASSMLFIITALLPITNELLLLSVLS